MKKLLNRFALLFVAACLNFSALAADEPQSTPLPLPDSPQVARFGYRSPNAALEALRERPDVVISESDGWTIVHDKPNSTVWSFTRAGNSAHPAGIKRALAQSETGHVSVVMTAMCGARREECDKVIAEFRNRNERMREDVQSRLKGQ
jgi:hypothetical protein